jgi:uncharacterized hydrophobic protein (TIGR00271 family)
MLHLRLIVPPERIGLVKGSLLERADVANVMHFPGAALQPAGDVILCDVSREATDDLLATLHALGVDAGGSIAVETMETLISQHPDVDCAENAESVVWESVEAAALKEVQGGWTFHVFLSIAVALAAIGVKLDSTIAIIAAMVVSPDFSPVAAMCVGVVRKGQRTLIGTGLRLFLEGFALAIAVVAILALLAAWAGWIDATDLLKPRPQTDFIWTPDRWSFVVALLAGAAGALSLTSSRSNALVGVFIAVTTVPAAGNLAFALAIGMWQWLEPAMTGGLVTAGDSVAREIGGSLMQLLVNVVGMLIAGVLALFVAQWMNRPSARSRLQRPMAGHRDR